MQSHTTELLTLRQPHIPIKNHQTLRIGMSWPRKVTLVQQAQLVQLERMARLVRLGRLGRKDQLDQLALPEVMGLLALLD